MALGFAFTPCGAEVFPRSSQPATRFPQNRSPGERRNVGQWLSATGQSTFPLSRGGTQKSSSSNPKEARANYRISQSLSKGLEG